MKKFANYGGLSSVGCVVGVRMLLFIEDPAVLIFDIYVHKDYSLFAKFHYIF